MASDHFQEVTILESDDLEAPGSERRGVPQAPQLHALLHMGRIQTDKWFPGLSEELLAAGAVLGADEQLCQYADGVRKIPVPGYELIGATRPLIEAHIRRRALSIGNVRLLRGRGCGLVFDDPREPDRVSGIRYEPRNGPSGSNSSHVLHADLVVDATGRNSRMGDWLEKQGWQAPQTETMDIDLGYATALFRRGEELPEIKVAHSLVSSDAANGAQPDTGAMAEVEGRRWMVVIANYASRRPTRDAAEFLQRCKELQAAPFGEVAAQCELLSDISTYRMIDSRRTRYEELERLPGGLVVAGDAVASFNPVYGQGMTSAALHASCLARHLERCASPHEPARGYFRDVTEFVDAAWQVSTMRDLSQPHVNGPYPRGYRIAKRVGRLISEATVTDAEVNKRFLSVAHMLQHPRTLRRPSFLLRVVKALVVQRVKG
ncbi:FAD-dependent monooxygenase [Streptomyces sp. MS2.AVA.5]|uniref:FAD-dependent monooxygenase n=1 Tax=Streptomyces achmelvichensis TaxID=3134111 RepID=A0ACC6PM00_9ACTN